MPTAQAASRTDAGLASELQLSVLRLRRRLVAQGNPETTLSLPQMTVLGSLYRRGELTVGELAAAERVQPPSMTRTITCLIEGGYVVRRPHETDGRLVLVSLSELGQQTLKADRARRDAWLAQRLTELTPAERATLRAAAPILQRLAEKD
jgi:DNA-binding MarR family transcriptional regulator